MVLLFLSGKVTTCVPNKRLERRQGQTRSARDALLFERLRIDTRIALGHPSRSPDYLSCFETLEAARVCTVQSWRSYAVLLVLVVRSGT